MDDQEMIDALRMLRELPGDQQVHWRLTWDKKNRQQIIQDQENQDVVVARSAKVSDTHDIRPMGYIIAMHNSLPRLLELAEAGLRLDVPAVKAELRARHEQIESLTAENFELKDEIEAQEAVQHALKDEAHALETDLNQARRALDAIWRRSLGPFDDRNRLKIQNIAAAYKNGGPKPARKQVAQWMEDER